MSKKCYKKGKPLCDSYCVVTTGKCVKKSLKTGSPYGASSLKKSLGKSYYTDKKYGLIGTKADVKKERKYLESKDVKSHRVKKSDKAKKEEKSKKRKKEREALKAFTLAELRSIYKFEGGEKSGVKATGSSGGIVKKDLVRAIMKNRKGKKSKKSPRVEIEFTPTKLSFKKSPKKSPSKKGLVSVSKVMKPGSPLPLIITTTRIGSPKSPSLTLAKGQLVTSPMKIKTKTPTSKYLKKKSTPYPKAKTPSPKKKTPSPKKKTPEKRVVATFIKPTKTSKRTTPLKVGLSKVPAKLTVSPKTLMWAEYEHEPKITKKLKTPKKKTPKKKPWSVWDYLSTV